MGTRLQRQTGQEVELANLSRGKTYTKDFLFGSNPTGVINRIDYETIYTDGFSLGIQLTIILRKKTGSLKSSTKAIQ